jgi:uridine phosphorylase
VLIERAVRDEGTPYHYLPPDDEARLDPALAQRLSGAFDTLAVPVSRGATWTTDAPFRETQSALDRHAGNGIVAVEMEAAALYAFARATGRALVCVAHLTNQMGRAEIDFEKGQADGAIDALAVASAIAERLMPDDAAPMVGRRRCDRLSSRRPRPLALLGQHRRKPLQG